MANFDNSTDPQRQNPEQMAGHDGLRQSAERNDAWQADPESAEGRASGGRMIAYSIAVLALLGVVFYGLNSGSINSGESARTASQPTPATQNGPAKTPTPTNNLADSDTNTKPPVAPGVRDVTPTKDNPGMTTGSAPTRPQAPRSEPAGIGAENPKGGAAK